MNACWLIRNPWALVKCKTQIMNTSHEDLPPQTVYNWSIKVILIISIALGYYTYIPFINAALFENCTFDSFQLSVRIWSFNVLFKHKMREMQWDIAALSFILKSAAGSLSLLKTIKVSVIHCFNSWLAGDTSAILTAFKQLFKDVTQKLWN